MRRKQGKQAIDKLKINEHETRRGWEREQTTSKIVEIAFVYRPLHRYPRRKAFHSTWLRNVYECVYLCRFTKSYYVYYIPIKCHKATDFHTN